MFRHYIGSCLEMCLFMFDDDSEVSVTWFNKLNKDISLKMVEKSSQCLKKSFRSPGELLLKSKINKRKSG